MNKITQMVDRATGGAFHFDDICPLVTAVDVDPGNPYAIGSLEGGHDAVQPELGTLENFRDLVAACKSLGMESCSYFTWRTQKWELEQYLNELTAYPMREFYRPTFFVGLPDAVENLITGERASVEWGGIPLRIDPALLFRCLA